MRWNDFPKIMQLLIFGSIFLLFSFAAMKYPGDFFYYLVFSLVANALLYFGFREKAFFFDTFIGVFFWLGFWLKLTFRILFMDGNFVLVGDFDGSPVAFDRAVFASTCGLAGFLLASYFRGKYIFNYPEAPALDAQPGLFGFYVSYRKFLLLGFFVFLGVIGFFNAYLGVYQRGEIARTLLPFGLNGVFTWLLLFGMASFVAVILKFELIINKGGYWLVLICSLLEGFVSSVSQLSRGMILSSGSLLYGVFFNFRINAFRLRLRFTFLVVLAFFLLFASSVFVANIIRSSSYLKAEIERAGPSEVTSFDEGKFSSVRGVFEINSGMVAPLLIDRWVGMEGVMAVSSYPHLGWVLWEKAWAEVYNENALGFYDENLIDSVYKNTDRSKHHFVSLPGIVAFFFYPGSYLFLFAAMFFLGLAASLIEIFVFKVGGRNVILCSLFAQVIAYRYMSFGYVPGQSYLLFGSIFFNAFLIYLADKALGCWRSRFAS